jgi:UDP-N-acetylglucosamine--N-acetylmuramyl-(pentapeptide) pyrophosphoryl-undecaprenol N-acetylglucosamine transferase
VWRLLGPRLRGAAAAADPLVQLRRGMATLAVRDADRRLVQVLEQVIGRP